MTYYASAYETLDQMARPVMGASLFLAGKPYADDSEIFTKDRAILTGYGPNAEAALLSLRADLLAAVGAIELEISHRRKTRVTIVPPTVEIYTREADDAEDADWDEETNPGADDAEPEVQLDDDDDAADVRVVVDGEEEEDGD